MKEEQLPAALQAKIIELETYKKEALSINSMSDVTLLAENIFIADITDEIEIKNVKRGMSHKMGNVTILDDETGEAVGGSTNRYFTTKEYVDNAKFIKVYQKYIKDMFSLSHPAMKVLGYFLYGLQKDGQKDEDSVYFYAQDCMEYCEWSSHGQVYRGLLELIRRSFIGKADKPNMYYINPKYSFNGKRLLIFKDYINVEAEHLPGHSPKQINDGNKEE